MKQKLSCFSFSGFIPSLRFSRWFRTGRPCRWLQVDKSRMWWVKLYQQWNLCNTYTLPETKSLPLKMGAPWKRRFRTWKPSFLGANCQFQGVCKMPYAVLFIYLYSITFEENNLKFHTHMFLLHVHVTSESSTLHSFFSTLYTQCWNSWNLKRWKKIKPRSLQPASLNKKTCDFSIKLTCCFTPPTPLSRL